MKKALEKLRTQVLTLAGKYAEPQKRKDLDQVFAILDKELERGNLQNPRIMALMRAIMTAQPGSSKAVNAFLRSPAIASAMHSGSGYNMD